MPIRVLLVKINQSFDNLDNSLIAKLDIKFAEPECAPRHI